MAGNTEALCAPLGGILVPFPRAVRELGIPLRTAEVWLRRKDPRLPPILKVGRWRFIAREVIDARMRPTAEAGSLLDIATVEGHDHPTP